MIYSRLAAKCKVFLDSDSDGFMSDFEYFDMC